MSRQPRVPVEILLACLADDFGRQRGCGGRLVPVECFEVIAHELLVEARRADAECILICWPEARRIGREALVDQDNAAAENPELEFRIGNDDSAARCERAS